MRTPRRPWTEAEDAELRLEFCKINGSFRAVGERVDRSEMAVRNRASVLGLTRPRANYTGKAYVPPAASSTPKRRCLSCRESFQPAHRGLFVCDPCKTTVHWRAGL
ncbi:hypothetical protein UFOVP99_41 [uncultured Caudovirales phage]|uniref:Myb-like domain-containing protein n=1 Tax=uncultured Caudovirales phage TaxID=2100421 RepID=A0A6J5L2E6_9CAUD|nr:hypothetical protein UFOVP99_41 [uncultured Caudovirales phage]